MLVIYLQGLMGILKWKPPSTKSSVSMSLLSYQSIYVGQDLPGLKAIQPGDILIKYKDDGNWDITGLFIESGQYIADKGNSFLNFFYQVLGKTTKKQIPTPNINFSPVIEARILPAPDIDRNPSPTYLTHVGLAAESGISDKRQVYILEMQLGGLEVNSLSTGNHQNYVYEVYRSLNPEVIKEVNGLASGLIDLLLNQKTTTNYSKVNTLKTWFSFDKLPTEEQFEEGYKNMLNGHVKGGIENYYCSQLIVWLYQGASFRTSHKKSVWTSGNSSKYWSVSDQFSPSQLTILLKDNPDIWQHVGKLPAKIR